MSNQSLLNLHFLNLFFPLAPILQLSPVTPPIPLPLSAQAGGSCSSGASGGGGSGSSRRRRTVDHDPDERRQKFLERNRAAATRCRQKRKLWVSSLEKKAEELTHTNLQLQVSPLSLHKLSPTHPATNGVGGLLTWQPVHVIAVVESYP